MEKILPIGFTSAVTFILLTSVNVGEGLAVNKSVELKYLINSDYAQKSQDLLKPHKIVENFDINKHIINPDDASSLSVTKGRTSPIKNRSKRYVIQGSRWHVKNLTYKIINYPKRLKKSAVDAEISRAFNVWSAYIPLNFTAKSNGTVDIDISFDDTENGDPFDGRGKVVARSYYPVSGGDVYFDIAENWTIGKRRGINLFQAAVHEIGHSLGLSHSENKSAIMAPMYRGYDPNFKLNEDDISAVQSLYGKKNRSRRREIYKKG